MTRLLARLLGIQIDSLSREEAALALVEREVTFSWRPVVVELAQEHRFASSPAADREVSSG